PPNWVTAWVPSARRTAHSWVDGRKTAICRRSTGAVAARAGEPAAIRSAPRQRTGARLRKASLVAGISIPFLRRHPLPDGPDRRQAADLSFINVTLLTAEIQVERTTHPDRIQERLEGRGRRRIAPRPPATPEAMPGRKPTPHPAQRHRPADLGRWFSVQRGGGRGRLSFFPPPPRPAGRDGAVQ